ncbi:MAG: hypothetical protein IPH62_02885 [Ignavibacteriae bacterium]|nr:hypothetical protein [Ignavibacteriota bacterium]
MKSQLIKIFISISILINSCELTDLEQAESKLNPNDSAKVNVNIAKWYDNHAAALSITNDAGSVAWENEKVVQKAVEDAGLNISYEFVSAAYSIDSAGLQYFLNEFLSKGFGYFGHGHEHLNHDLLSFDEAYRSFKMCYHTMIEFGLKPVSYAYPGGFGYHISTQEALKKSGFLSGRKFEKLDFDFPYIMPNNETQPSNWFQLPTLVMQAYNYEYCSICINNTDELIPFLDNTIKLNAWLIITYHPIGREDLYGYYYLEDFKNDLEEIKKRDFWVASMDDITLYTYERNSAKINVTNIYSKSGELENIKIKIEDNLNDLIYNVPLTVLVDLPNNWVDQPLNLHKNSQEFEKIVSETNQLKISIIPDKEEIIISQ